MNDHVISCPEVGYHVTTDRKVARYVATGAIIAPVRFWPSEEQAAKWAEKTGRGVILRLDLRGKISHPIPDHKPARFTPDDVSSWEVIRRSHEKEKRPR